MWVKVVGLDPRVTWVDPGSAVVALTCREASGKQETVQEKSFEANMRAQQSCVAVEEQQSPCPALQSDPPRPLAKATEGNQEWRLPPLLELLLAMMRLLVGRRGWWCCDVLPLQTIRRCRCATECGAASICARAGAHEVQTRQGTSLLTFVYALGGC